MARFVIRPSVAVDIQEDGVVSIYYASGKRLLRVKLNQEELDALRIVKQHGLNSQDPYQSSEIVQELIKREILVSEVHDPSVWPEEFTRFDRQLRLISDQCTPNEDPLSYLKKILNARICVLGLGGMGTNIIQQLVPMGFRNFLIIDPDTVSSSNLNRTVILKSSDIGSLKTEVTANWISRHGFEPEVIKIESILNESTISSIDSYNADIIINCADTPSIQESTATLIQGLQIQKPILIGGGYFLGNCFAGPLILPKERNKINFYIEERKGKHMPKVGGSIAPLPAIAAAISSTDVFNFITGLSLPKLISKQAIVEIDTLSISFKDLGQNINEAL